MGRLRWVENARTGAAGTAFQKSIFMGSSSAYNVNDTADTKFVALYNDCGATSGDNRGIYNRFYLTGTGGGGESLRSYTEISGVVAGTAHGAHLSLGMGESTTGGAVTGLGVATRSTLGLPNVALASGGTYAAIMPEIYSFGSSSDAGAVTELSFVRICNGGDSTGKGTVDDDAFAFVLTGFASGSGHLWYDKGSAITTGDASEWIRVKTPGGTRYLILYDSPS